MALKDFIPPAILEMRRRARPAMPMFGTFDEAIACCGTGYSDDELVRVVAEKTRRYRDSLRGGRTVVSSLRDASVAIAVGLSAEGGRVNCIDFGGAAGAHYFLAKSLLGRSVELDWNVVETQPMAAAAGSLREDGLKFFSDLDSAVTSLRSGGRSIDLLFTSCALPYVRDPEEKLRELVGVGARRIFVTRNPLSDRRLDRRVAIQTSPLSANGPGPLPEGFRERALAYPVTFCDRVAFEGILSGSYDLDLTLLEESTAYYVLRKPVPMYGYLGRLRST